MDRDLEGLQRLQTELLLNNNNHNDDDDEYNSENHNHRIHTLPTNHEDLNSVLSAAKIIQKEYSHIDLLINNAGMAYSSNEDDHPVSLSKHGQDLAFTVNYLSHFLLTEELLPLLHKNGDGRIVQVTSSFHWKVDGSELTPIPTSTPNNDNDNNNDDKKNHHFILLPIPKQFNLYHSYTNIQ